LLNRGPAVLDLLPTTDRASAEVQQRLDRCGRSCNSKPRMRPLSRRGDASSRVMPLSKVLRLLASVGQRDLDYRKKFNQPVTEPALIVHFDKTPFWPALISA